MLVRALIVLLAVLNAGVATWWIAHTPAAGPPADAPAAGVARLQLVGEKTRDAARETAPVPTPRAEVAAAAPAATMPIATAAPAAPVDTLIAAPPAQQCVSFGPFAMREAADQAAAKLRQATQKVVVREQGTIGARGWRVSLPPQASAEEASEVTERIAAAGFTDFIILRQGAGANSISLGLYRSEESARRRAQALQEAGFPAVVQPVEPADGNVTAWVEVIADEAFDPKRAQSTIRAAQHRMLDCATLR